MRRWVTLFFTFSLLHSFQTVKSQQNHQDVNNWTINSRPFSKNCVGTVVFLIPVKRVEFGAFLPGENGLDTIAHFSGKINLDSHRIKEIDFCRGYANWRGVLGENHPFLYERSHHSASTRTKGKWIVTIVADDVPSRAVVLKGAIAGEKSFLITKTPISAALDSVDVGLSGFVNLEWESGNNQYSNNNQPSAFRIDGGNAIKIKGVPIDLSYGVTTEHSTERNLNYFNVDFDHDALVQQIRERALETARSRLDTLKGLQAKANDVEGSIKREIGVLDRKKLGLADSLAHYEKMDSIWRDSITNKVNLDEKHYVLDSLTNPYQSKLDEANEGLRAFESKRDSLESTYAKVAEVGDSVQGLINYATDLLNKYKNQAQGFDSLARSSSNGMLTKQERRLLALKKLRIGKQVWHAGDLLGAVSLNGLSAAVEFKRSSWAIAKGKLHSNDNYLRSFFSDKSAMSSQKMLGVMYKTNISSRAQAEVNFVDLNGDSELGSNATFLTTRTAWMGRKMDLSMEWTTSSYSILMPLEWNELSPISDAESSALKFNSGFSVWKNFLDIKSSYRQYGENLKNLGYSRFPNGLSEFNVGVVTQFWNSHVRLETFASSIYQAPEQGLRTVTYKGGSIADIKLGKSVKINLQYLPVSTFSQSLRTQERSPFLVTDLRQAQGSFSLAWRSLMMNQVVSAQSFRSSPDMGNQSILSSTNFTSRNLGYANYQFVFQKTQESRNKRATANHTFMYGKSITQKITLTLTGLYLSGVGQSSYGGGIGMNANFRFCTFSIDVRYLEHKEGLDSHSTPFQTRLALQVRY